MASVNVSQGGLARDPRDIENVIATIPGARAVRIVDKAGSVVGEHSHDWPILSLFVTGDYTKISELGATRISSPAVVLHAPGAPHGSVVTNTGAEQIDIEFDPAWAGLDTRGLLPVQCWIGGAVAIAARKLALLWMQASKAETLLAAETKGLIQRAFRQPVTAAPIWVAQVAAMLRTENPPATTDIASRLGMHPGWLAHGYRHAVGEGMGETLRRLRVERATAMLRAATAPHAQIALEAGFCDQSHMIRSFRAVLGRTPSQVATEIVA